MECLEHETTEASEATEGNPKHGIVTPQRRSAVSARNDRPRGAGATLDFEATLAQVLRELSRAVTIVRGF
jgi:hypothetical protein